MTLQGDFPIRLGIDQTYRLSIIDSRMIVNLFPDNITVLKPLIGLGLPTRIRFGQCSCLQTKLSDADRINMQIYSDIVLESLDL